MIAQRDRSDVVVVRSGVTDDELARIVSLAGFGPSTPDDTMPTDDDHATVAAARLEASARTVRAVLLLVTMLVLGGVASLLV